MTSLTAPHMSVRAMRAQVSSLEESHHIRNSDIDAREGYKAQYHPGAGAGKFAASDPVSMFEIV